MHNGLRTFGLYHRIGRRLVAVFVADAFRHQRHLVIEAWHAHKGNAVPKHTGHAMDMAEIDLPDDRPRGQDAGKVGAVLQLDVVDVSDPDIERRMMHKDMHGLVARLGELRFQPCQPVVAEHTVMGVRAVHDGIKEQENVAIRFVAVLDEIARGFRKGRLKRPLVVMVSEHQEDGQREASQPGFEVNIGLWFAQVCQIAQYYAERRISVPGLDVVKTKVQPLGRRVPMQKAVVGDQVKITQDNEFQCDPICVLSSREDCPSAQMD